MTQPNYSPDVLALSPSLSAPRRRRQRDAEPPRDRRSKYEIELEQQLRLGDLLDGCEAEYQFDSERGWRFDFAWLQLRIAAEVDGGNRMARRSKKTGNWIAVGRHTQSDDYSKINRAVACGWIVFRFTPEMIRSGEAFATLQDALRPIPFT